MPTDELTAEIDQAIQEIEIPGAEEAGSEEKTPEEKVAEEKVAAEEKAVEAARETVASADKAAAFAGEEEEKLAAARELIAAKKTETDEGENEEEEEEGEGGSETKPKEKPKKEIVTPQVVISDDTLTRAVEAGIPLADARQFQSEVSLERMIGTMHRLREEQAGGEEVEDPFKDLPELAPENHEPEVIEYLNRLAEIAKKQHEAFQASESRHDEISRAASAANTQEVEQWFDKQVSELGDDFSEALGAGGFSSLAQGSPQLGNREKIANQMSVLLMGCQASGLQAPPREEIFDTAARLVLKDEYQKIHEEELTKDLRKRESQHIQRAGGKKAVGTKTPEEETAALLDEKFGR